MNTIELKQKQWLKRMHIFGLTVAISNGAIRRKRTHKNKDYKECITYRRELFDEQHHRCALCGKEHDSYKVMSTHHCLPWCPFPQLRHDKRNLVLLCPDCHEELHINPFKNARLQQAKADELGIDLKEYRDD